MTTKAQFEESMAAAEAGLTDLVRKVRECLDEDYTRTDTVAIEYTAICDSLAEDTDLAVVALMLAVAAVQLAESKHAEAVTA